MSTGRHPYHDYTLDDALEMVRSLIHGPLPPPSAPKPSLQEALDAVCEARKHSGFNWITGRVAEELIRSAMGEDVRFTL